MPENETELNSDEFVKPSSISEKRNRFFKHLQAVVGDRSLSYRVSDNNYPRINFVKPQFAIQKALYKLKFAGIRVWNWKHNILIRNYKSLCWDWSQRRKSRVTQNHHPLRGQKNADWANIKTQFVTNDCNIQLSMFWTTFGNFDFYSIIGQLSMISLQKYT